MILLNNTSFFLDFFTEWRKYSKEGYENTLEILEKMKTLSANQNVLDAPEGWVIHERLFMGFSKNKEEDVKKLRYLADSAFKNRGNDRDRSLRAIVELTISLKIVINQYNIFLRG